MARQQSGLNAPRKKDAAGKGLQVLVPQQNVELVKDVLGFDLTAAPDLLVARVNATISTSSSPYTSAEMLDAYVQHGMPDVKDRVLATIDEERKWRHEREEQEQNHRQKMEREEASQTRAKTDEEHAQQRRGQRYAFLIAFLGVIGSLLAAYFKVPNIVCIMIAVSAVGGPSTATVLARVYDRART